MASKKKSLGQKLAAKYGDDIKPEAIDAIVSAAKAKHGRVGALEYGPERVVLVRAPSRLEYKSFLDRGAAAGAEGGAEKIDALHELAADCVVYPEDREARKVLFEALPGALTQVGSLVLELGGLDDSALVGEV